VRRASVATSRCVGFGEVLIGLGNGETSQFRVQNPGRVEEGVGPNPGARWSFLVGSLEVVSLLRGCLPCAVGGGGLVAEHSGLGSRGRWNG
jgi:hypothetical protein